MMRESWNQKNARLDRERDMRQAQRAHNPGLKVKVQKSIVTDDIFGLMWLGRKIKALKNKMKKANIIFLMLIPVLALMSCSSTYSSKVGIDGTKSTFYNGAVGGKGGAVKGGKNGEDFIAVFYDNEQSFRDGVIGLATYGVATVIGSAVEAGQLADTAQHAASQVTQQGASEAAANAASAAAKADLLKAIPPEGGLQAAPITFP